MTQPHLIGHTSVAPPTSSANRLATGRLGTWDIVFFVLSAAAPLTVVISSAPTAFRIGGIGAPGAMLVAGIVLIFFAIGFTAMSKSVKNSGAFYAYVSRGIGKPVGIGIALVTLFAYLFLTICFYAYFGFYAEFTAEELFGITLPWWAWAIGALLVVAFLGYRQIDVGAKVLAVLLTAEIAVLLIFSFAVILNGGPEQWSLAPFNPQYIFFGTSSGMLFVTAFGAFLGFESTAIYAEEAKRPERTIPVATFIAVAFLAVFYAGTFWILTVAFGVEGVIELALGDGFETMVITGAGEAVGPWAAWVMKLLIVTSFLACLIAFHNASSRYTFNLGRDRLIPRVFGRTHPKTHAPHIASFAISAICVVAIGLAAMLGSDPFLGLGLWTYATGVQGLVFAQAAAAVAVVMYFAKDRQGHSVWRVVVAPVIGALGLIVSFVLIVTNFEFVTGLEGPINWVLLLPTPVLLLVGIVYGLLLRRRAPQHYNTLTETITIAETAE